METGRLHIRRINEEDEKSFINGISDRKLRTCYGFPDEMDLSVSRKIFQRFCSLQRAFSLIRQDTGEMVGFLLDVEPELPTEIAAKLPQKGRTLAYAVYTSFQRQGYMEETLCAYIPSMDAEYIHCGHFPENEASKNLLIKLGFKEFSKHQAGTKQIVDEILLPSDLHR